MYEYRGKLTLEAELPFQCASGCGRRTDRPSRSCAVCSGTYYYPPRNCGRCGHKPGSGNCQAVCGEAR
jgi:hypothetical protein